MNNLTQEERNQIKASIKEVFTTVVNGKTQHIAIAEQPQDLADHHGLTIDMIEQHRIDPRTLTVLMTIQDHQAMAELIGYYADHIIIVYNYEAYKANKYVAEAMTYHELGHIMYPTGGLTETDDIREQEYRCDEYAVQQVGKDSVLLMLNILRSEMLRIEKEHLSGELSKRIINIMRYELPAQKASAPTGIKGYISNVMGKIKNLF